MGSSYGLATLGTPRHSIVSNSKAPMLQSLAVGTVLTIATILVHACCITTCVRYLQRRAARAKRPREFSTLSITAVALLLTHTFEITLWAGAYYFLVEGDQFANMEEAVYFSAVTFTSLGYGDVVIQGPWRMLSAIQAINGLLITGWSTAFLFAVVQRVWQNKFD